jgi:hypothetical protein
MKVEEHMVKLRTSVNILIKAKSESKIQHSKEKFILEQEFTKIRDYIHSAEQIL